MQFVEDYNLKYYLYIGKIVSITSKYTSMRNFMSTKEGVTIRPFPWPPRPGKYSSNLSSWEEFQGNLSINNQNSRNFMHNLPK